MTKILRTCRRSDMLNPASSHHNYRQTMWNGGLNGFSAQTRASSDFAEAHPPHIDGCSLVTQQPAKSACDRAASADSPLRAVVQVASRGYGNT